MGEARPNGDNADAWLATAPDLVDVIVALQDKINAYLSE